MRAVTFSSAAFGLLASGVSATPISFQSRDYGSNDIITRDVVVVGGGSGGTYSALSLKDKGKSVVIVEKKDRLGGHTETYIDPATGTPVNLGVVIWHNITVVTDYFKRLNVSIGPMDEFHSTTGYYDFTTGKVVNQTYQPSQTEVGTALQTYIGLLAKYPGLDNGTFLPDPVPEELYEPFSKFVDTYNLSAAVPSFYNYNPGVGDLLDNPTVEQIRYWGRYSMTLSAIKGFLTTTNHNSSELYTSAEKEFTGDLLLSSEVVSSQRDGKGVKLVVKTPTGTKLIQAKKLLIAVPPKTDILSPWANLSNTETSLFSKFINVGYYVGLLKNTGIPFNQTLNNAQPLSASKYNLPKLPGLYSISPSELEGVQIVYYGTPQGKSSFPESDSAVQDEIIASIKKLQKQNPGVFSETEPEWVTFKDHAPYYTQVSSDDIKNGFYKDLYALQGQRNTFWTGASWQSQDSSEIWKFSEYTVVPAIISSLGN